MEKAPDPLRALPSVEQVLQTHTAAELISAYGRPLVLDAIRAVLAQIRSGKLVDVELTDQEEILARVRAELEAWVAPSLVPVINASGVILHTNLGRAPLSQAALQAIHVAALTYNNLEFDLAQGRRGSRLVHCEAYLTRLTGAEAALVVNNNAAAVMLALAALARRKRVVVSRSQLVEIGGGFRIPEVLAQSGARLVEVGATNRVYRADYEAALEDGAGMLLRAHPSNFRILGFTSEPALAELAELAHSHDVPLVDDLGSGALLDTARFGLAHEPTVQESIQAGADLVCFSGDKLLGGPQAGILVGRSDLIARLRRHPLARALRADKLCLAALSATLLHYLKDEAIDQVPVWQMISQSPEQMRARAAQWRETLQEGEVIAGESTVGGGSLPGETLPTSLYLLESSQPNRFLEKLRRHYPPIIARIVNDQVAFDPRTVLTDQDKSLLDGIAKVLKTGTKNHTFSD